MKNDRKEKTLKRSKGLAPTDDEIENWSHEVLKRRTTLLRDAYFTQKHALEAFRQSKRNSFIGILVTLSLLIAAQIVMVFVK